jgi:hypothetical protein
MSCCSKEKGCCCGKDQDTNSLCMCLPYVDTFMIAAQIISIIAFLISWLWWVTFIVGLISLVLLQLVWCCRQSKIGLFVSVGISTLAGVTCTIAGIVMIIFWKDQRYCSVWTLTDGNNDYYYNYTDDNYVPRDYCSEQTWAVVAFFTAVLWFSTTGCILYFVRSGRYAEWEEKVRGASDTTSTTATTPNAIEMGAVQHQQDGHQQEQQTTTGTISFATASAIDHDRPTTFNTADSYVLPEISNKVDNV